MAKVVSAGCALDHLEQAFDFIRGENPAASNGSDHVIVLATMLIAEHPLDGPRVHGDIRELVISYGASGFVALYRFLPFQQEARILAVRHQRELGYRP